MLCSFASTRSFTVLNGSEWYREVEEPISVDNMIVFSPEPIRPKED